MVCPILSLCIPTNGVIEWVFPVLDSIYKDKPEESCFEVVIEDNGNNTEFKDKILEYQKKHSNIKYFKSSSQGFLCQIDCFKHAKGEFVKFVNHRARLADGALDYLVKFADEHKSGKPVVFFSNGQLERAHCHSFDSFVSSLKYWSSWSGGLAFWKDDIELLSGNDKYNELFPHTDILFLRRDAKEYIIDDSILLSEIEAGHGAKGNYNLFKAFAVEYLSIINDLYRDGFVTVETFLAVKESLLGFLANCYIDFIILKHPASYSFDSIKENIRVFYSWQQFKVRIANRFIARGVKKIIN